MASAQFLRHVIIAQGTVRVTTLYAQIRFGMIGIGADAVVHRDTISVPVRAKAIGGG